MNLEKKYNNYTKHFYSYKKCEYYNVNHNNQFGANEEEIKCIFSIIGGQETRLKATCGAQLKNNFSNILGKNSKPYTLNPCKELKICWFEMKGKIECKTRGLLL